MRSLVTGATGFLGSHLARELVARGDRVRVLVRTTSDRSRLSGLELDVAEGDVTDAAAVDRAVAGCDRVFHVAAYLEFGPDDPSFMEQVNVGGTEHVLGAAATHQVPAVHVSSVASFGPTGTEPRDETNWCPDEPLVAYERTKRSAHLVARRLAEDGASVRIGAPGGIYGRGDVSELASLIRAYVLYPIPIGYLPEMVHSVVNVDDCADGLIRIAERGADGDEFILASETTTIAAWFELFCGAAGRRPPSLYFPTTALRALSPLLERLDGLGVPSAAMAVETIAMATRHIAYSGAKARRQLGWSPRSLEQGMTELVAVLQTEHLVDRIVRARSRATPR